MTRVQYELQRVSSVDRDGIGVEIVDKDGNPLAEIFRSDVEQTLLLSTFGNEISLHDIELLISYAKERLAPFENGSALSEAISNIVRPSRAKFGVTVNEGD